MKIYMAPMEGVTDFTFRNTFAKYYGGVDKYFTPFISPRSTESFTSKELRELSPENNAGKCVVPQYLTCVPEHFIWAMKDALKAGYNEVNLNLGCPSGTVTSKKKGSGFLLYPEELECFFEKVFSCETAGKMKISVKTRIGFHDPEEFGPILDIYNKFPLSELIIHPRVRDDMYDKPVRREYFEKALHQAKMPLVYNGDIKSAGDIKEVTGKYTGLSAIMLGRGLVAKPWLAENGVPDVNTFKAFHDELFAQYKSRLSGPAPIMAKYKEFWYYFMQDFVYGERYGKEFKKAKTVSETEAVIGRIMAGGMK